MFKRTSIFILILLSVMAVLGYIKYQQIQEGMAMMAAGAPPPTTIEVTDARLVQWRSHVQAVGTLTALDGIDVSNEVEGVVENIYFRSGQQVKKGERLIELNDDVEQADLVSFKAQEDLARTLFKRNEGMWKKKTISETEFDNARSNLLVAQAKVTQTRARIAKKSIRAPFSGVLGIRHVSIGQYLSPGSMLVSLQNYDILYADFSLPEKYLSQLASGLEVNFRVSAYPDQAFTGVVQAVDAKVDEATRNISVRAQLNNEMALLRPGMYADIDLLLAQTSDTVIVPTTAIVYSSFGDALFVVTEDDKGELNAKRIQVTLGEQRGDEVTVLSGLNGGEQVVQAGVSKLKNNAAVKIAEKNLLKASE